MDSELAFHFTNNEYRVLLLADIQECSPMPKKQAEVLSSILDATKPDLVILLGDMIFGLMTHRRSAVFSVIDAIDNVFCEKQINYLVVSGNHDVDSFTRWPIQLSRYSSKLNCLTPDLDERNCKEGYSADIKNQDDEVVCRLLFIDSNKTIVNRYGLDYKPVSDEVISWEKELLSQDNANAYVFQHIPVNEIYSLLLDTDKCENSVRGRGFYRGHFFIPDPKADIKGTLGEAPCPPWTEGPQFNDWVNSGKVRAAFFGHDHLNDLEGTVSGIRLVYTPTAGLRCYGNDDLRGGRLIRFLSDGSYVTDMVYYKDIKEGLTGE